jgi:hypothetical protein
VKFREWPGRKTVPHVLRDTYHFYEMEILEQWFLFFTPAYDDPISPATLAKQLVWLEGETGRGCSN